MHCIILKNKSVMLNKFESIILSVLHVLMNDLQFVTVYNLTCLYNALGQHKFCLLKKLIHCYVVQLLCCYWSDTVGNRLLKQNFSRRQIITLLSRILRGPLKRIGLLSLFLVHLQTEMLRPKYQQHHITPVTAHKEIKVALNWNPSHAGQNSESPVHAVRGKNSSAVSLSCIQRVL